MLLDEERKEMEKKEQEEEMNLNKN